MDLILNVMTAWISLILALAVTMIWILRILTQKKIIKNGSFLFRMHRMLRKHHKAVGIAFIVVAFVHGLFSSDALLSLNWGTACFVLIAGMGLSFYLRTKSNRRDWINIHRLLTLATVFTLIIHLVDVGGFPATTALFNGPVGVQSQQMEHSSMVAIAAEAEADHRLMVAATMVPDKETKVTEQVTSTPDPTPTATASSLYHDGVYVGVADAYGPQLTVEVTIENDTIVDIIILSHNEKNARFYQYPFDVMPSWIMDAQSVEVDSIAGATFTTIGLKNAVLDALEQAANQVILPEQEPLPARRRR